MLIYTYIDESGANLIKMPEPKPLKKETSVINSPTQNKQVIPKIEPTDKKL